MKLQLAPGIYRLDERRLGYSRISDTFARDGKLSTRGRSVGLYLLSHREGFVLRQEWAAGHLEMAPNTFRGALEDLAARGYVRFGTSREGQRTVGTWYVIHDEPLTAEQWDVKVAGMARSLTSDSEVSDPEGSADEPHKGYQSSKGNQKSTPSADADAPPSATQPPMINPPVTSMDGVQPQHRQDGRITRKQLAEQHWQEFWDVWKDKKLDLPAAKAKWQRAVVALKADPEVVIAAARAYRAQFNGDLTYMKYPKTWLHNQCWLNEVNTGPPSGPEGVRVRLGELAKVGDAETAAREAGLSWPGWNPSEAAKLFPELPGPERMRNWGREWITEREDELVDGMMRRVS